MKKRGGGVRTDLFSRLGKEEAGRYALLIDEKAKKEPEKGKPNRGIFLEDLSRNLLQESPGGCEVRPLKLGERGQPGVLYGKRR